MKSLELQWVFQAQSLEKFEATPLVVNGVLYTQAPNDVVAMDAETGRIFWVSPYAPAPEARACCGRVNRGLAILGDTLFMGTIDGHLIALDAKTGKAIWNVTVAKAEAGYAIMHAPLVVKDKVIVGTAGGEYGIRGFLAAYDAKTGKEAWRFNTIPGPGEPGHETWSGDSWMHGGASVWVTGSYDPQLNLTYWGIGNPGPDWNSDTREGANLYSDSVVALDADTGKLKWYFQFSPHDDFDYDSVQVPVAGRCEWDGKLRRVMLWANRNGFYYVLDRTTGEFSQGKPFAKVNWTTGLDDSGRPVRVASAIPRRHARLSRRAGRDQLVLAFLQPAHRPLLHQHVGKLRHDICQRRCRLQAGITLPGRPSDVTDSRSAQPGPARRCHQQLDRGGGARLCDGARHTHRTEEMEVRYDGRNGCRDSDHGLRSAIHRRARRLLSRAGCKNRSAVVEGERRRTGCRGANYVPDRWKAVRGGRRGTRPFRLWAARIKRRIDSTPALRWCSFGRAKSVTSEVRQRIGKPLADACGSDQSRDREKP